MSPRGRALAATGAVAGASAVGALALSAAGNDDRAAREHQGPRPGPTATRASGPAPARSSLTTRWVSLRPALLARTEVAAARAGNSIYVVGGFVPAGPATTSAVERYDVAANRWTRVRSMPLALNHPAAVAHRGAVYVVGGYTGRAGLSGETDAFLRYDPASNRWARMPAMPTARAALAVGVIGDRLYAAGGARAGGTPLRSLEVFDFRTRRWAAGPAMAVAREHVAGATAGGGFYVLGGRRRGLNNLATAERYVPALRRWERLPDLRRARSGIAAAAIGNRVLVFGGEEPGATIAPVELYDPRLRRWLPRPTMRTPRHGLGGVAAGARAYAIEGGVEPGFSFSRAIEALDVR
jgi:hypothetical protein